MEIGKLSSKILKEIIMNPINSNEKKRSEVILGPNIGEDCSIIDLNNELFIVSTDPITAANKNAGYLAVHINCNDIASSGGEPIGILLTILLPKNTDKFILEYLMNGIYKATNELNIEILGGHTEVTESVNKPIISATIIGKSNNKKVILSSGAEVGQKIIMTKWAGLEGTTIISNDYYDKLLNYIDKEILETSINMSNFISVLPESRIAMNYNVTCMHDVTEGGIFGALWEVAECSNKGMIIYKEKIPVKYETKEVCKFFNINPYRLISSGSMIITTFEAEELVNELRNKGIEANIIGKIVEKDRYIISNNSKELLLASDMDEIYKIKL